MRSLSREIEIYLKQLLDEQEAGMLEIQRSVLSELFRCVPSQINYVLSTRFTLANGYLVESRRGGGGYLRIISLPLEDSEDMRALMEHIGDSISEREGENFLLNLYNEGAIGTETAQILRQLTKDGVLKMPQEATAGEWRAHLFRHLLAVLSLHKQESNNQE